MEYQKWKEQRENELKKEFKTEVMILEIILAIWSIILVFGAIL